MRAREISGDPLWGDALLPGEKFSDGSVVRESALSADMYAPEIERNDPALVQVVKELGDAASGRCGRLRIVEIEDGPYEIDEYDGQERVVREESDGLWLRQVAKRATRSPIEHV